MDNAALAWGLARARQRVVGGGGIGTLGERTLHAALKYALEPDEAYHEIPVEGFVADILRPDGVIEVQTGSFYPLRKKLPALLAAGPVTVVHPLAAQKRIIWVDPADGSLSKPGKSPRPQRLCDMLEELFWLSAWLDHPGLQVKALLLAMDEYRLLDGRGDAAKIGATRYERIPTAVLGEYSVTAPSDMPALLPAALPDVFTAAEFAAALRLRGRRAFYALRVLTEHGQVYATGEKQGRAALYARADAELA